MQLTIPLVPHQESMQRSTTERVASSVHDTVVRMALLLAALDPRSAFTEAQRVWVRRRCEACLPFTATERARLKGPLLAYLVAYHARSHAIVARQFAEETRP